MANNENFWGNITNSQQPNNVVNNDVVNQFQQFLGGFQQNGGFSNYQQQLGNLSNMMKMMNTNNPSQLIQMLANQKGINGNQLKQIEQMAMQMFNKR